MASPTRQSNAVLASADARGEPISDEDVVARVLGGDTASFELIMRRYNQRLFRVSRSILADDAEAEDVVQEAYLRAFKHLDQFEGRAQFSTWLTRIAVYEATARRRKLRRLHFATQNDLELASVKADSTHRDASEMASQRELTQLLSDAVESLPVELRVVFTLRLIEQLDTNETAECLQLSPANVKVRLHRARLQLQSWIDRRIGEEARRLYAFDGARCDRIVQRVMSRLHHS